ncbi:MAG: ATP-binding protein [Bacteroidia bacterium]
MEKQTQRIIRIALIGPESTAKSTLAESLAKHYNTMWIQEYSREYLAGIDRKYTLDDILIIAKEQLKREQQAIAIANTFIFADTELILSKVWCEDVYKTCPNWILENIIRYKYDLYLLTSPDIPWEEDVVRENPHRREFFFDWYKRELKLIDANYAVISGLGEERLQNCIEAIEKSVNQKL